MMDQMPEVSEYLYSDDYSFIRFVFECRRRLAQDSRKEDIAQRYLVCEQKTGKKAIEYIKQY